MRDSHRAEAEGLLRRAVEEEVRRSGGRTDGNVLLSRARAALDAMAGTAGEEYSAYTHALDEAAAGQLTFRQRYAREGAGTPLLVAAVAAVAAAVADVALGTGTGTAVGAGVTVGVVGAAATVVKVVGAHVPAAHHRAGAVSQPGGPEQLRLQWLTALEVRGIRPFLDQQRMLAASTGPAKTGPKLRGADKSAAARGRSALEQSFGQLPEPGTRSRAGGRRWRGCGGGCRRPARARRPNRRWWCCTGRPAAAVRRSRSGPSTSCGTTSAGPAWSTCAGPGRRRAAPRRAAAGPADRDRPAPWRAGSRR